MEMFTTVFVLLVSITTIKNCQGTCTFCENGGYCDVSRSRCICPPGFAGKQCQTGVKYMLDECSKSITLNATNTLVLKSQSYTYLPSTARCSLNIWAPTPEHQILVNVIRLSMHNDCYLDYLKLDDENSLCGSTFEKHYVIKSEYTHMHLHLSSGVASDKHSGFIITLSTFIPQDLFWGCDEFRCSNTRCIAYSLRDNGFDDCGDNSDEPELGYCFGYECNGRCIPDTFVCDCNTDCNDGSDEWGCSCPEPLYGRCDADYFWCDSTKTCMHNSLRCNGIKNCNSPYDEKECYPYWFTTPETEQCGHNAFRCPSTCIPKDFVCDSYPDCSDGSDEKYCHMSTGVLTGVVVASLLSVVCFVCATLLLVSIIYKRRQVRIRRNNIRTVSAYVPPEPQNLLTNCEIPPSYETAVGIDDVKESDEEQKGSSETKDTHSFDDEITLHNETFDENHELPLMDAISEISKTDPPNNIIEQ